MSNDKVIEILLNEFERQWSQAKQSEDQRAAFGNFIVVIALAAQGFIVDKDFPSRSLAVAVIIIVLGIFGALVSAKYYERFRLSMSRVGRLRERLDAIEPTLKLDCTEAIADKKHVKKYPVLSRFRLNILWRFMMVGIVMLGCFDVYVILRFGH